MTTARGFPTNPLIQPTRRSPQPTTWNQPNAVSWSQAHSEFMAATPPAPTPAVEVPSPLSGLAESFRHSSWQPFRKRVDAAMCDLTEVSERRLSAFRTCGCDASIEKRFFGPGQTGVEYRIRSTKCHDRFCLPCSAERSNRIREALLRHMYRRSNMSLITLTLRASTDCLKKILDRITKAFRCLRNKKIWKKAVKGGCAIIETKVGTDGVSWHVHYHVLCEATFIRQDHLAAAWLAITGDSRIVDVRRVQATGGAVNYITKYVTKAADHSIVKSPTHLSQAIIAFTGRRLVSTFAAWRGLQLMEKPNEDSQTQNPTDWRSIGTIDEFVQRARDGSTEALHILRLVAPRQYPPAPPTGPPTSDMR
jgi:Replication protein